MSVYRYHLAHVEEECSKFENLHARLTPEQLEHEYQDIGVALHLYARSNGEDQTFEVSVEGANGVFVSLQSFQSEAEADRFMAGFPSWLMKKLNRRFCPAVRKVPT